MTYQELPLEVKERIEILDISVDVKEQYVETLTALMPNKESVIAVLMKEYAQQCIKEHEAEQALISAGYNVAELRLAYWNLSPRRP